MEAVLLAGIAAAASAINSGLVIWNFLQSPSKKNAEEIGVLRRQVGDLETKLKLIEGALEQMPSKDTVHALDLKVTELNGTVNVVHESLQAVERTAHRIENFLLDQAKR